MQPNTTHWGRRSGVRQTSLWIYGRQLKAHCGTSLILAPGILNDTLAGTLPNQLLSYNTFRTYLFAHIFRDGAGLLGFRPLVAVRYVWFALYRRGSPGKVTATRGARHFRQRYHLNRIHRTTDHRRLTTDREVIYPSILMRAMACITTLHQTGSNQSKLLFQQETAFETIWVVSSFTLSEGSDVLQ